MKSLIKIFEEKNPLFYWNNYSKKKTISSWFSTYSNNQSGVYAVRKRSTLAFILWNLLVMSRQYAQYFKCCFLNILPKSQLFIFYLYFLHWKSKALEGHVSRRDGRALIFTHLYVCGSFMSGGLLNSMNLCLLILFLNLKLTWNCTLPVSFQVLDVQSGITLEACMSKPESTAKSSYDWADGDGFLCAHARKMSSAVGES